MEFGTTFRKKIETSIIDALADFNNNLEKDFREMNDVARHHPEIVSEIKTIFEQEHLTAETKSSG